MKRLKWVAGLALATGLVVLPAVAQEAAKKEPPKPAPSPSQAVLEQWNEIGRKLIIIAEDLPEDKYDYKPNPDSRTFRAVLLHVSASMYYFTDFALGQKPRYPDDPKPADLKINSKADLVAFVKKCVQEGAQRAARPTRSAVESVRKWPRRRHRFRGGRRVVRDR